MFATLSFNIIQSPDSRDLCQVVFINQRVFLQVEMFRFND